MVEVEGVEHLPVDDSLLWGAHLDCPQAGDTHEAYAMDLSGWALGKRSPSVAIEFFQNSQCLWRTAINSPRDDIAEAFPQVHNSGQSGFSLAIGAVAFARKFELLVVVALVDGTRVPLAVIRGGRSSIGVPYTPRFRPLLVTTMGRSGSTWLMRVLGEHPQLITYRAFRHEPRQICYWLEVLKALSEPASFSQSLQALSYGENWWLGTSRPLTGSLTHLDPELREWVAGSHVRSLTTFCLERIDEFYTVAAKAEGRTGVVCFAEKCWPGHFAAEIFGELYPGAREIVLVRDFRDTVCSWLAYIRRHGVGRELIGSERQFIKQNRDLAVQVYNGWRRRSAYLLRYEDLIREPQATFEAVLNYLGLDASTETIRHMLERAEKVAPETLAFHQTSKDVSHSIGRWREDLSPELQAECAEAFGGLLEQFGYK